MTRAGITRRLDHLEAAGLITRATDPEDLRGILVRPTPMGQQLGREALAAGLASQREALTQLSVEERIELSNLLKKLLLALDDAAPESPLDRAAYADR